MKTIAQVQAEIKHASKPPSAAVVETKAEKSKRRKEVEKLRKCLLYLEMSPSEDFLKRQIQAKRDQLEKIKESFDEWISNTPEAQSLNDLTKQKALYNREMGTRVIRNQITHLEYILS